MIPSWLVSNGFDYKGCYPNNTGSSVVPWYNEDGVPQVDQHRFPDLKGMVAKAHGMGLRAGWCKDLDATCPGRFRLALPPSTITRACCMHA